MGEAFVDEVRSAKTRKAAKGRSAQGPTTTVSRDLPEVVSDETADYAEFLAFEHLVASLSSEFIEVPPEDLGARIDEAVAAFGEFADVDRCIVILFSADRPEFQFAHFWATENVETNVPTALREDAPWFTQTLLSAAPVIFSSADQIPEEATFERAYARQLDIRSSAFTPLIVDGVVIGCFGADMIGRGRQWTDSDVSRIRVIGRLIGGAFRRRQQAREVSHRVSFEQALTNVSARLAAVEPEAVNDEIVAGLACIGECLGTDLGTVLQFDDSDPPVLYVSHEWDSERVDVGKGFRGEKVTKEAGWPWLAKVLPEGRPVLIASLDEFPAEAALERAACKQFGIKAIIWVPVHAGGELRGYIAFNTLTSKSKWRPDMVTRLQLVGEMMFNALHRADAWHSLQESRENCRIANRKLKHARNKLRRENEYLRDSISVNFSHDEIVGESKALRETLARAEQVAPHDSTVLIRGETGTGKELLARAIHNMSLRKDTTMVTVNCAAMPGTLMEAELFGREKGAYTGAMTRQVGRFEVADGSTIFLDEISELSPDLQANLLRIIQFGEFERLGSTKTRKVDVRIIAATNSNLESRIKARRFRQDLYYRLNVFPILVPPLRERRADVPQLVWAFIREFEKTMGKRIETVPAEAMEAMQRYDWPGNVRELRNYIERAMITSQGPTLNTGLALESSARTGAGAGNAESEFRDLAEMERDYIRDVLQSTSWRVRGDGGAAEILGLKPTTLEWRMKKLNIRRPA